MLSEYPFQLVIKNTHSGGNKESLLCKELLRYLPGKRRVFDAVWNNRDVIVKIFSDRYKAKRHLKREWTGLINLKKRKLDAPEPLFCGRTENGNWAIVEEKIPDSISALERFHKVTDPSQKLDVLLKICRELAKQHIQGIVQKDLHLGNILLQDEKIFLLDPARIRLRDCELGRKKSISQLAMLMAWLPDNQTDSIIKICREYFNIRGWNFENTDNISLQNKLAIQRKKTIRKGLKKCLRTNRRHIKISNKKYVAEFCRDFCLESDMNDFIAKADSLMESGRIIKNGLTSTVSHLTWAGKNIVVKRYNHIGTLHSLRHTLKGSRSRRCWLHGNHLEMLNISTPKPLAYIEKRKAKLVWKSYLITEYVKGTKLNIFLKDENISRIQRNKTILDVTKLLEKLWKQYITHDDLKHTNILITDNGPVLTDLDAMTIHRWKCFFTKHRNNDLTRFLQEKEFLSEISITDLNPIWENEVISRRFSMDFNKYKSDDWIFCLSKDFSIDSMKSLLIVNDLSEANHNKFSRVPSSDFARVYKTDIHSDNSDFTVYIKKYLCRSSIDFIKHLFRPSRARREFNASLMLKQYSFTTPEVLGLAERRFGPFNIDNLLVTKDIIDAIPIYKLIHVISESKDKNALLRKRSLIRSFGLTIGKMHSRGIYHGDLRLGNILVTQEEQKWKFYFVDNERTKKFRDLPENLRKKNLVQVNMYLEDISKTDRMRFFNMYLSMNPEIQKNSSIWIKKIIARTNERLLRKDWSKGQKI